MEPTTEEEMLSVLREIRDGIQRIAAVFDSIDQMAKNNGAMQALRKVKL